jgi:hypothetical protein
MRLLLALLLVTAPLTADAALEIERLPFASGERAGQPSVAVDRREGFVVTWQEREGDGHALRYAVLDPAGAELRRGTVAVGDDWFVNGADFPNLAVLDNGDWVTFVLRKTSPGTYSYEIRLLRSRDAGASWDPPVLLHRDGTDTEHGFVSLIPAGGDRVRAVWLDGRQMAGADADSHEHGGSKEQMSLRSAALGRDGVPHDEHELDDLTCACCQTDAVRLGERMLVAYRDRTPAELRDISLVEFADGSWSRPRTLHADGWTIAACPVNGPALAADGSRVAALWPSMASGEMRVAFAAGGPDFGAPRTLAEGPAELGRLDLAAWADGRWLASRVAAPQRVPALRLSLLDADGASVAEYPIADKVGGYPRIATIAERGLLVWAEQGDAPGSSRIGVARIGVGAR